MGQTKVKLKRGEIVYCLSVVATVFVGGAAIVAVGGPLGGSFMASVIGWTGFTLCALFPIGIVMEFRYARSPIPLPVVLSLILTGIWSLFVLQVNLRSH